MLFNYVAYTLEEGLIKGRIEAATRTGGRNVTGHRGMAAKGVGQWVVEGDAVVRYLNNGKGRIKGNLTVQREMINCDLVIGGDLICDQGTVIGGNVAVKGSVRVAVLGSNAETATSLECMQEVGGGRAVGCKLDRVSWPGVGRKVGDVGGGVGVALKGPIKIGRDEHQRLYCRQGDGPTQPLNTLAKTVKRAA